MNNKGLFKQKANMYVIFLSILGIALFALFGDMTFDEYSPILWALMACLVAVLVLCRHFTILLPPKGNALSMDSAIYLACIFAFGLEFTLLILFVSSIIGALYQVKILWWKHIFNFATFSIMIVSAYSVFVLTGGQAGVISPELIHSYIFALVVYMLLNVFCIGMYFYLLDADSLLAIVLGAIKESLSSYISILILSLLLGILLLHQPFYGLFLFSCLLLVLSYAFKMHFKLYEEASLRANVDQLTGLYNHGYFKELLEGLVKEQKDEKMSLAMIDIDDFNKYNGYFGHLQGDELLKCVGLVLKEGCGGSNYTLARYGGEEFTILMPNTTENDAFKFVDGLRKKMNDTYFKGVEILPHGCLSFSAGIIYQEGMIDSSSELLGQADRALYYAKAQGKNKIHLYDEKDVVQKNLDEEKEIELLEQQVRIFLSKDINTYKHSKRVFTYAIHFANKLQLSDYEKKTLIMGALIHDIGKLEIPRDIMNKEGKLDPHEWEMIKKHVTWGKEIISINKDLLHLVPLVELHHERYDGKGYPHGLKGDSIPKLARILCIIDAFDAMTTERPYQKTKTFEEAIVELEQCSGKQFDPKYVPLFIEMIREGEMRVDGEIEAVNA
ncbi:diguanylate cyclase [Halalkalibacter alkaliphilus]|uniref:Diguanylate cyclase n=1 Tax=Halalkalibacter alkaliphilus TaxID=2917993 RepID=A0A9X2CTI6_9BACI|nr:diguanylate cyclase [Halalkalibacter alkaliphilus]MCL7747973.1 diguanylate cyclase [Halalkalibacter alkaliphilus]